MVRTEPVQQRSAQRVAHLLDTAAALIDELGIDALTTSDVAARSDSSVGVVYRYFPNIQSLLRALAARNLARFTEAIYDALGVGFGAVAADASTSRSTRSSNSTAPSPGFARCVSATSSTTGSSTRSSATTACFARALVGLLAEKYDFTPNEEAVFDVEVAIEIGDALLQRAFLLDKQGDPAIHRRRARGCPTEYLRDHAVWPEAPEAIERE